MTLQSEGAFVAQTGLLEDLPQAAEDTPLTPLTLAHVQVRRVGSRANPFCTLLKIRPYPSLARSDLRYWKTLLRRVSTFTSGHTCAVFSTRARERSHCRMSAKLLGARRTRCLRRRTCRTPAESLRGEAAGKWASASAASWAAVVEAAMVRKAGAMARL